MTSYDAVVLAGGSAARLGGVHKPSLRVGGSSMLDRVLAAVTSAQRRIVVGPVDAPALADIVTREDPPGVARSPRSQRAFSTSTQVLS